MGKGLTPEQLQQVRDLFEAAAERPPDEQKEFLSVGCASDEAVRAKVEQLLRVSPLADGFLKAPLFSVPFDQNPSEDTVGRRIGPYQILSEIGQGGMSTVYLAVRADAAYDQHVAIKVVWPGVRSGGLLRRFRQERQILADLDHPNIARLLDGGTTVEGWPYLVMECVEGTPITVFCEESRLNVEQRLQLFCDVCAAVEYAHQKSVIHCDLKPNNILVTPDGTVKLLDFGIAKLVEPDPHATAATLTRTGLNALTPDYASPEQIRGEEIAPTSDVYSLGVLLYELLTGVRPYRIKSPMPHEVSRAICEVEPEPPSRRIAQLARLHQIFIAGEPEKLRRRLAGDLDNIVMKALSKDASRRYQSVEQFSRDIARHLAREPVQARRPTLSYRMTWFMWRYKLLVAVTALVIVTLLGGIIVSLRQTHLAESLVYQKRRLLYAAQISLAQQALKEGNIRRAHDLLEAQRPRAGEEDLRGFEWRYLRRLAHQEVATLPNGGEVLAIAFSPDGQMLAAANRDRTVKLWDVAGGKLLSTLQGHQGENWAVAFAPSTVGRRLLATGGGDNTIRLWDLATRQTQRIFTGHTGTIRGIAFTPDERWMLSTGADRTVRKWDMRTGQTSWVIEAHENSVNALALSPDGKTFVTGSSDSTAKLWDLVSGRLLQKATVAGEQIRALAFSPDGRKVALGTTGETVDLWDLRRDVVEPAFGAREISWAVAFSPKGETLAAGSVAHTAMLWDVAERRELMKLPGHLDRVYGIAFSPDGRLLATASKDGTVKFWDVQRMGDSTTLQINPTGQAVWTSALSPDGKILAVGSDGQFIRLWDIANWREIKTVPCQCGRIRAIAFSPDGRHLATGSTDQIVRIWGHDLMQPPRMLRGHTNQIRSLTFSPDSKLLASASEDSTVRLWEVASGAEQQTIRDHTDKARAAAFSPDGGTLVSVGDDSKVVFWSTLGQRKMFALNDQSGAAIVFSPDGRSLAVGDHNYAVSLLDAATGRKLLSFIGHANRIWGLAFSPDGKRLATAGGDRTVRIWDAETGYELLAIEFPGAARSVLFTQDGNWLVVTGDQELVKVFEATAEK